jgi:hypothetical protein
MAILSINRRWHLREHVCDPGDFAAYGGVAEYDPSPDTPPSDPGTRNDSFRFRNGSAQKSRKLRERNLPVTPS